MKITEFHQVCSRNFRLWLRFWLYNWLRFRLWLRFWLYNWLRF
tara:strand:- start:389 stop:517 length:129 start_codon:yes stop_codon:yes gene_type:complete